MSKKKNDERSGWSEPPKSLICLSNGALVEAHVNGREGNTGYVFVDNRERKVEWFAVDGRWYEVQEPKK